MADTGTSNASSAPSSSTRVLVVTDDERLRAELVDAFPTDYAIDVVADARAALEYMEGNSPAVAVVDMQTGSAGGVAFVKEMDQDPRIVPVPVVMILERAQDRWLARQAGAGAILTKPVAAEEVVADALSLVVG